jgi:hypothetical protein
MMFKQETTTAIQDIITTMLDGSGRFLSEHHDSFGSHLSWKVKIKRQSRFGLYFHVPGFFIAWRLLVTAANVSVNIVLRPRLCYKVMSNENFLKYEAPFFLLLLGISFNLVTCCACQFCFLLALKMLPLIVQFMCARNPFFWWFDWRSASDKNRISTSHFK